MICNYCDENKAEGMLESKPICNACMKELQRGTVQAAYDQMSDDQKEFVAKTILENMKNKRQ